MLRILLGRAQSDLFESGVGGETPASRQLATRVGGWLMCAGAVLALINAFAPPTAATWLIVVIGALAAFGLAMALGWLGDWPPRRLTIWLFGLQCVLSLLLFASGAVDGNARIFFVWLTPYVAFFLGRQVTLRFISWVGVLLISVLLLIGGKPWSLALAWLSTMSLMLTISLFVLWSTGTVRGSEAMAFAEARRDALTGLGNRIAWNACVEKGLAAMREEGGRLIVLLIDLDDFKGVNDTFGHHAGDQLLGQVAPRLLAAVRPDDTVARLGGDEFAVLCHDREGTLDPDGLAGRLQQTLNVYYLLDNGEQVFSTASIGVVVATAATTPEELLSQADVAMYQAKVGGRNHAVRFDDRMAREATERHELVTALHLALTEGQCHVEYQPVYGTESLALIGAEALLRWDHPIMGPVSPDKFIPLAEASGLVGRFTDFVLEEALGTLAGWRLTGWVDDAFTMSVNISVRDLRPGLAARVFGALARTGVPPAALSLEVTETALMDTTASISELGLLRDAGVWVILDDFGSGYSSLAYLERLPLDGLKIDREFIPTANSPRRWEIVGAIIDMSLALGLHLVAEGIETEEQARKLHQLGCRWVQGFLYGSPAPADLFGTTSPAASALGPFDLDVSARFARSPFARDRRSISVPGAR